MVFSYTFAGLVGLATAGLLLRLTDLDGEWIAYLSAGTALSSILVLFPFAKSMWVYLLQFTRGGDAEYRAPGAAPPGNGTD
jgi:hypothetical protein